MNSRLLAKFRAAWHAVGKDAERTLVAVSGGADSMALTRLLLATGADPRRLWLGHFDHGLRADSADDGEFVRELGKRLGILVECGAAAVRDQAALDGDGIEAAARSARYGWLQTTAERLGTRYVLTAHTADDQAETILHRVIRGTGIGGLAGIPRVRDLGTAVSLVRPLLEFSRDELRTFLQAIGQTWREDPTNASLEFTRNRLRHELIPLLTRDFNPGVREALLRLGKTAEGSREVVAVEIARLWPTAVTMQNGGKTVLLNLTVCRAASCFVLIELLIGVWRICDWPRQAMTQEHWEGLSQWITRPEKKGDDSSTTELPAGGLNWHLPGGIRAKKTTAGVELRRL